MSVLHLFLIFVAITLGLVKLRDKSKPNRKRQSIISKLEKAEKLLSQHSGGYSGEYLSAEEFHADFVKTLRELKDGNNERIQDFYLWFSPTCQWDDFVGKDGEKLANSIYKDLIAINEKGFE